MVSEGVDDASMWRLMLTVRISSSYSLQLCFKANLAFIITHELLSHESSLFSMRLDSSFSGCFKLIISVCLPFRPYHYFLDQA